MRKIVVLFLFLVLLAQAAVLTAFEIGILRYDGGDWYSCRPSVENFVELFTKEFPGVRITLHPEGIQADSPALFDRNFYILNGHGIVQFDEYQIRRLRDFLDAGGFIFVNDDFGMDVHFRPLAEKIFPGQKLNPLPDYHPLYSSCFSFTEGIPKIHEHHGGAPRAYGLFRNGKLVLLYAYNTDIIDGWDRAEVHGNPEQLRRSAFEFGCNILFYAMTR